MKTRKNFKLDVARSIVLGLVMVIGLTFGIISVNGQQVPENEPGRGLTAQFEIDYLKFIADHHFAALRMTELAAGTDAVRDAEISPNEGTSPSPSTQPTQAKATLDMIKSLARRANRTQREEILTAQRFLRDWYGINYQPHISAINRERISILEQAQAGDQFNHLFLEVFSRHHYTATTRSLECQVASELRHDALERYCRGIVNGQLMQITEMRNLLCDRFQICDYQPLIDPKGQHSGSEPN